MNTAVSLSLRLVAACYKVHRELNYITIMVHRNQSIPVFKSRFGETTSTVPVVARMSIWIPFMENDLRIGPSDIIVGHSSGACAAIRFAEKHPGKLNRLVCHRQFWWTLDENRGSL